MPRIKYRTCMIQLHKSLAITSLAMRPCDCLSDSEVTLKYKGEIDWDQITIKPNKIQLVCIIIGMFLEPAYLAVNIMTLRK